MDRWIVTVRVWPHSTGSGREADQAAVGEERQTVIVKAEDIEGALSQAKLYLAGVRTNPMVWKTFVSSVCQGAGEI